MAKTNGQLAIVDVRENNGLLAVFEQQGVELAEVAAAVAEASGNRGMTVRDFERIGLPGGKSKSFQIGEEEQGEVIGAVLLDADIRVYFSQPYGGKVAAPPDCFSTDAETGIGNPGGSCETCPMNQWGTKVDEKGQTGKGKACAERRMLALFTPDCALPRTLSAPPSSLRHLRADFFRVAGKGIRPSLCLWSFTLTTEENGGFAHPVIHAKMVRKLSEGELALIETYRDALLHVKRDLVQQEATE